MSSRISWSQNKVFRIAVSIAVIAAGTTAIATMFRQEFPMVALDLLGTAIAYYSLVGAWSLFFGHKPSDDYETAAGTIHHLRNANQQ